MKQTNTTNTLQATRKVLQLLLLCVLSLLFTTQFVLAICNEEGQFCVYSSTGECPGGILDVFGVVPYPDGDAWCQTQTGNPNYICCAKTWCDASSCGDGIVDAGEECDLGANMNGPYSTCSDQCTINFCGDGILQQPNGQGITEYCDDAGVCSLDQSVFCSTQSQCTLAGLGTCIPVSNDGCSSRCTPEVCGNGFVEPNGADGILGTSDDEECDDGNNQNGDGCTAVCKNECSGGIGDEDWTNPLTCEDGLDNDCDGATDYDDPDCYCQDQDSDSYTCVYSEPGVCVG